MSGRSVSGLWAVVLAAGESKRMNSPKLLLPFDGKTIIETVIDNIRGSVIRNIMVVLGYSFQETRLLISDPEVKTCYNSAYREGMLSSVKCGINSLPVDFEAVIVIQGDQPMIPSLVINELVFAWQKSQKGIIIPVFMGKRGHPILIDNKYKTDIGKLNADEGLHALPAKFGDDLLEIEINTSVILRDIDTREDYLKEIT